MRCAYFVLIYEMKLPVRKCYHAAKVGFLFLLVIIILGLFEEWRGGKRSAKAQSPEEEEYERQILEDEARIIPGLGEGGLAAHLDGEAKRLGEESEKKLAMNVYLSDRISYNRTLKDYRNPACERVVYDAELPSASVILIFHNEPYSVVVRTIWSVVNSARRDKDWYRKANYIDRETGRTMKLGYPGQDPSSPFVYLKEIILVDDNSTLPELKGKLSHYVRTRLPPDLIRIVRLPDRMGLTQARLAGSRYATGEVIVFLDSHCEGQRDWLRPLLQRIKDSPHTVVVPIIDVIEASNFYYSVQDPVTFQVGGFTFIGHFTWIDVPEREKKRRGSDIAPTWSPTMAGGLFAINRQYFWEIGAYDEQMAGWGGENLEMSFRIWQCGGTLETIPCSRVGHVFRSFHPYGLPANTDTHGINTARMAEVWMDDYAELFYLHRPDLRKNPKIGDLTHRRVLREKLKCKDFQWYLDNVFREKFVPVRDVFGFGRFMNPASGMCIDTLQREDTAPLGVYPCHQRLEPTQYLALSLRGELRDEERCAEPQYARRSPGDPEPTRQVLMMTCHGRQRGQKWRYLDSKQLQHVESGLCLTTGARAGDFLTVSACYARPTQIWNIDYSDLNGFKMGGNEIEPSEQELRLQRLRGQRRVRISRSLMSVSERTEKSRRHQHHKNKAAKNKFILKMFRTHNGTEDHLEADIYCKHRRLYPNNSFVRDIVRVLNDKDIKVINNGRVFEHNKVRTPSPKERFYDKQDMEAVHEHAREHAPEYAREHAPIHLREHADESAYEHAPKYLRERADESAPEHAAEHVIKQVRERVREERSTERAFNNVDEQQLLDHSLDKEDLPTATQTHVISKKTHKSKHKKRKHLKKKKTKLEKKEHNRDKKQKIIIEDFVAMNHPAPVTEPPKKKHKRVRPHTTTPSEPPATTVQVTQDWDDSIRMDTGSSEGVPADGWTGPKVSSEDGQKTDQDSPEDWPIQVSYFRVGTKTPKSEERSQNHHVPTPVKTPIMREAAEAAVVTGSESPLKLVMRSNLTFNLGDELFRWKQRKRTVDDVAQLLEDLVPTTVQQPEPHSEEAEADTTPQQNEQDSSGSGSESAEN